MPDADCPDEKTPEVRSPSETLIRCLEDFGRDEPTKILVLWITSGGDMCWSESGPSNFSQNVGLLECVKARYLKKFLED